MKDDSTSAPSGHAVSEDKQICGIAGFLQIFQEIDEAGDTRRDITGDVVGPFFSRAVYECVISIGLGSNESNTSARRRSV
jgi:hypothetical protein